MIPEMREQSRGVRKLIKLISRRHESDKKSRQ